MFEPNNYEFLNVVAEIEDSVNNYIQALENQEKSVVEKYKKQLNNLEKENKKLKNKIKKINENTVLVSDPAFTLKSEMLFLFPYAFYN